MSEREQIMVCLDLDETLVHCRKVTNCTSEQDCNLAGQPLAPDDCSVESFTRTSLRSMHVLTQNLVAKAMRAKGWTTVKQLRALSWMEWCSFVEDVKEAHGSLFVMDLVQSSTSTPIMSKRAADWLKDAGRNELTITELSDVIKDGGLLQKTADSFNDPACTVQFLQMMLFQFREESPAEKIVGALMNATHATTSRRRQDADGQFECGGNKFDYWLRPHAHEFIARLAKLPVEVVFFTASLPDYADAIISVLDPNSLIKHRLYRDAVLLSPTRSAKDLSLLGRPLERTVLVDNSLCCMALQPANGLLVQNFHGFADDDEDELLRVLRVLQDVVERDMADVRPRLKEEDQKWRFRQEHSSASLARNCREKVERRTGRCS